MKMIIAYIRPAVLERVVEALRMVDGLTGMSVMESEGFGRSKDGGCRDGQGEEITWFCKKVRIELMVSEEIVRKVVDTIRESAWAGERGEGKIYVLDLVEAIRIRTNERGEAAV